MARAAWDETLREPRRPTVARFANLPDHLPDVSGKDRLPGLDQQDKGLAGDMQIDPCVVCMNALLADGLPMVEVDLHFWKLLKSFDEAAKSKLARPQDWRDVQQSALCGFRRWPR